MNGSGLRALIAGRIREGGPLSVAEFVEIALYHPELGYYARSAQKTGRAGDFFTSVDVGPLFGELLARQLAEMWQIMDGGPFDLVEAGAGRGRLTRDVLDAAAKRFPEFYKSTRVALVDRSPAALAAQPETLGPHAGRLFHSSHTLPERIRGVVFANELLDALPPHVVTMTSSGLGEIYVDVDSHEGTRAPDAPRFVETTGAPSTPRLAAYLSRAGARMAPGWRAEVNLAAEDWVRRAAAILERGFLIVIDYGRDELELYGAHAAGTLTAYRQHTQDADILRDPGDADITSQVDLTAVVRAAADAGLDVLATVDQTYFVLGLATAGLDDLSRAQRNALKTLLLPGGMGSSHKVMVFGRGVGRPQLIALSQGGRLT